MPDRDPPDAQSPGQWYVWVSGELYGPVGAEEMRQWAAEGRLQPGWQVQPVGGEAWLSPTAVSELWDIEAPAPPAPTPDAHEAWASQLDEARPFADVMRDGWELWRRHISWGVVLTLLQSALVLGPTVLPVIAIFSRPSGAWPDEPFDARWLLGIAAGVVYFLLMPPVALGAMTCCIDTARHDEGILQPLLSGFRLWSSAFVLMIGLTLVSLLPYLGYLVIFVTPIYTLIFWTLADRQRGLIDACRQVSSLIAGRYWWAFAIILVASFIGSAGVLLLGVGVLFSGPLQYLITTLVYLDLAAREGWDGSQRTPPTGGRLALEVLPMVVLTILLFGGLVAAYLVWWH